MSWEKKTCKDQSQTEGHVCSPCYTEGYTKLITGAQEFEDSLSNIARAHFYKEQRKTLRLSLLANPKVFHKLYMFKLRVCSGAF